MPKYDIAAIGAYIGIAYFGLNGGFAQSAHAEECDWILNPIRVDREVDLVLCGDDLPPDIKIETADEIAISLVYEQSLKECSWDDERRGFHLVLQSERAASDVDLQVIDTQTDETVCDLAVDFPCVDYVEPDWVGSMPEDRVKVVDVNGYETRYFESGNGPPLVLVHGGQTGGFNNHARKWEQNFPGLAEHFRVIALDRLGQGGTENLKRLEDYANYYTLDAEHLAAFLDAIDVTDATLVGHSQGGWPITRVALDRPDLVRCLVNVGTVMVPNDAELMYEALDFVRYVAGPVHPDSGPTYYSARRGIQLRFPTGHNITPEKPTRVVEQFSWEKNREAREGMASLPPNPEHRTLRLNPAHPIFLALREQAHADIAAGGLEARSLVIFGAEDLQVPTGLGVMFNDFLAESGVETTFVAVDDAGHSPHAEFPEQFNQAVIDYCQYPDSE
ncbi:MAG: alpha/beta hydrolase [Gammaproteobacteria bacterium]|nr:alpha/beta hydrolase [Gammaproteobacteria bacterium]